jgi:tripartite-type tricarboxylate transporter receptor subunit TctC
MADKEYERFKDQFHKALENPEVKEIFREAFREAAAEEIAKTTPEQRQQIRENLGRSG